jgi:hypothetical protein
VIAAYSAGSALVWIVWVVAGFACLASGVAVVSFSNPFYSALALIGNRGSRAGLYLLLAEPIKRVPVADPAMYDTPEPAYKTSS